MKITTFMLYMQYNKNAVCPVGINPARWGGMLRWFASRHRFGDWMNGEYE